MPRIKLGMNTCFAVKRWPEPEVWCRLIAKEFGLSIVQFCHDQLDPRVRSLAKDLYVHEVKEAAEEYGLIIESTFNGTVPYMSNQLAHPDLAMRIEAIDWFEQEIIMAAQLGAKATGTLCGALSVRDFDNPARRDYLEDFMIDAIGHLSRVARLHGLEYLIWEPMPTHRERPATISDTVYLYERANAVSRVPIRLLLDLGHACAWRHCEPKDIDPYQWLRELGPKAVMLHAQQTDGRYDRHWPMTKHYNEQGIIQVEKILTALDEAGVEEITVIFELLHAFEENEEKVIAEIKESVALWRKYI